MMHSIIYKSTHFV